MAAVQRLTWAYLRTALYEDAAWPAACAASMDSPNPLGRVECKRSFDRPHGLSGGPAVHDAGGLILAQLCGGITAKPCPQNGDQTTPSPDLLSSID